MAGRSEVLRDPRADVCSLSWKRCNCDPSIFPRELMPLISQLQSVSHGVSGTALPLFPLELTELSIN